MKKNLFTLVLGLSFLLFSTVQAQVVFTSGFESWNTNSPPSPTDWFGAKTSFAPDSVMQYTTSTHFGMYACKLQNRSASHKRLTTQAVPVTSGMAYNISFWVKGHGSIRTGLYKGGSLITDYMYNSYIVVNSSSWTQHTQAIASDTTSAASTFILSVKSTLPDLGDIQVDSVTITAVSIPTVTLHDIQYTTVAPYNSPYNGQIVTTSGICTARNNKAFFIQDSTGPWHGIYVYDSANAAGINLALGDLVTLTGGISEYYNYTEMSNLAGLTRTSAGNPLPAPYIITGPTSEAEGLEGILVEVMNATCKTLPNSYGEWAVFDTDSTHIDNLFYSYSPTIGTHYNIIGPVYFSFNYNWIEPRDINDIQVVSGINKVNENNFSIYPNPVTDKLYINLKNPAEKIRITNIYGQFVKEILLNGETSLNIDFGDYARGCYIVSVFDNGQISANRIIIKQ